MMAVVQFEIYRENKGILFADTRACRDFLFVEIAFDLECGMEVPIAPAEELDFMGSISVAWRRETDVSSQACPCSQGRVRAFAPMP